MSDRCRSCKAPVRWVVGPRGNLMILDADPSDRGTFRLEDVDVAGERVRRAIFVPRPHRAEHAGALYIDHHATCPDAEHWRRR